jgi:peroxiredoxin
MTELLQPGESALEFELYDIKRHLVRLSDFRGQPLVLAFLRGFM